MWVINPYSFGSGGGGGTPPSDHILQLNGDNLQLNGDNLVLIY